MTFQNKHIGSNRENEIFFQDDSTTKISITQMKMIKLGQKIITNHLDSLSQCPGLQADPDIVESLKSVLGSSEHQIRDHIKQARALQSWKIQLLIVHSVFVVTRDQIRQKSL